MPDYYLDIETYSPNESPDFNTDKIIAITYQHIDSRTGLVKGDLKILKEWESSEKTILTDFYKIFHIANPNDMKAKWNFVAIGHNLSSDFAHLAHRWNTVGINVKATPLFAQHPYIDIQSTLIMMNKGDFGATLHKFAGTTWKGSAIAEWYQNKDYKSLQSYIEDETTCFLKWYQYFVQRLPEVWAEYAIKSGIIKGDNK